MRNWKKAAAMLCGTAAAILLAANALSAFAYESVELDDRRDQLTDGVIGLLADELYAAAGETVEFGVLIANNTGYTNVGISLNYDEHLEAVSVQNKAVITQGPAAAGLMNADTLNTEKHIVGYSSMGDRNNMVDGVMFTVQLVVPADAEIGTVYPVSLYAENLTDRMTRPLEFTVVNGWIEVRAPETTTTTTTTTTVTSTTATTARTTAATSSTAATTSTTSATTEETTTEDTATESSTTLKSETTTSSSLVTDSSTSRTTKKTDRDPTHEATTSGKGGNGGNNGTTGNQKQTTTTTTKVDSAKTGDVGTGAAIAAGMLAAATAIMFRSRKH